MIVWKSAKNCVVESESGKKYLDFTAGNFLANIGHAHPAVVDAIVTSVSSPLCSSDHFRFADCEKLEKELLRFSGRRFEKTMLCLTPGEAIEAALRISWEASRRKCIDIGCFENAYHGKNLAEASISDIARFRSTVAEQAHWIKRLPYPDAAGLNSFKRTLDELEPQLAAIIIEPIQSFTLRRAESDALKYLRVWCDQHECLLVFDEIETGLYRTGYRFEYERSEVIPDILCLGCGLSSSLPIAALLLTKLACFGCEPELERNPPMLSPPAVAAARACLTQYKRRTFQVSLARNAHLFEVRLGGLARRFSTYLKVTHYGGLFGAIRFVGEEVPPRSVGKVLTLCHDQGLLVHTLVGEGLDILKISPPLTIQTQELNEGFDILERALALALQIRSQNKTVLTGVFSHPLAKSREKRVVRVVKSKP